MSFVRAIATLACATLIFAGCTSSDDEGGASGGATDEEPAPTTTALSPDGEFFDSATVTDISVEFAQNDYDAMIEVLADSGDKDWIEADVTIDGVTFEQAGMRLKGNSSLFSVGGDGPDIPGLDELPGGGLGGGATAETPEDLPWLVSLDKYVAGQSYGGVTQFVIRSNPSDTSLNEAVALELIAAAGLPTQQSTHIRFSVNGGDPALRLAIENPNDDWDAANFDTPGILYKAEAGGDYSYRGDDPEAYKDIFDQETRKDEEDLAPLTEFLDWLNNSDDATFAAELEDHLDVDAFATYMAVEDLLGNFDDIDGPGNNSYLRWDEESGRFTVVAWDHNLALGGMMAMMGGGGPPGGGPPGGGPPGGPPTDPATTEAPATTAAPPTTAPTGTTEPPEPGAFPGGFRLGGNNLLVERWQANEEFVALYDDALAELRASLYASGAGDEILERRAEVLRSQAADLVDEETIAAESETIAALFTSE